MTPTFHGLGFAGQMIVWAMRKRLHSLTSGADDGTVQEAFRRGEFDALYKAIMAIVDVLSDSAANKIQLHHVACPCLAPHELHILETLGHVQAKRSAQAYRCLAGFMGTVPARLLWPAITAAVDDLDAHQLEIQPIETKSLRERVAGDGSRATVH